MFESPFPGTDPFLEVNPRWQVFHGWFVRKLAEQNVPRARELGHDLKLAIRCQC